MKAFLSRPITLLALVAAAGLQSCQSDQKAGLDPASRKLSILSGSENESLKPLIEMFNQTHSAQVSLVSRGSVEIMRYLEDDSTGYDAVWPANSLWISLGDKSNRVKQVQPISITPVVLGVRTKLAEELGWKSGEIKTESIAKAVKAGKLRFAMTSATQSNSGAVAYLGFLHALKGGDEPIQVNDLADAGLRSKIRDLLKGVERTSGSSGWLKDMFLNSNFDAMVNYESVLMETNLALVNDHRAPLRILYPEDGISLSDSPLGLLASDSVKKALFTEFQTWLRSPEIQARMPQYGRRPASPGAAFQPALPLWDTSWGVQPMRILSPLPLPSAETVRKALELYQTDLRKPSHTVFCLDYSGSMSGPRVIELRKAMRLLLSPEGARANLLQPTHDDILDFLVFSDNTMWKARVKGNDTTGMLAISDSLEQISPMGGTAIHSVVSQAMDNFKVSSPRTHVQSVVLLTDGESNTGASFEDLQRVYQAMESTLPVFSIRFGEASQAQLDRIATLTHAKVFDGTKDLARTFRQVRGYN